MTSREWLRKYQDAIAEHRAELESGKTTLDFDAWRVTKGYIVTRKQDEQLAIAKDERS